MKQRNQFLQLLFIAGFLFAGFIACDKTDDPVIDFNSAGTMEDADGNIYNTVKIGTQVWMAENLKTTKYNDGTPITNVKEDKEWGNLTTGAYCNYDNLNRNAEIYGRLYNWHAVNTGKLTPEGWHVPSEEDWTILQNYLISNGYNFDGSREEDKIAKSLCAKTNWKLLKGEESESLPGAPGVEHGKNNSSGFSALPGGIRSRGGLFGSIGELSYWWSVNEGNANVAYVRYMYFTLNSFEFFSTEKEHGLSIRLVRIDLFLIIFSDITHSIFHY